MASDADEPGTRFAGPLSPSHLGLVGQVATSWGVAGGLVASVVVTVHVLLGQLSSSLGFVTTTVFFLIGSLIGYLHGGILAYLGRPDIDRHVALHRLMLAALYAVPAMVVGWVAAMLLVMSAASLLAGRPAALLVSLIGWAATVAGLVWAVVETRAAVQNLCRRWPGARALLVVLGLAFLALLPVFIVSRPTIWIVGMEPSATAAGVMAAGAALWIVGPLATLVLLGVRAWSRHHSSSVEVPHGTD
ncbi:MAG: hypothetical protein R3314_03170 [Longimicrobiales bacterium]|nr:hypothetical protein [Longimicrobiales bacterium]